MMWVRFVSSIWLHDLLTSLIISEGAWDATDMTDASGWKMLEELAAGHPEKLSRNKDLDGPWYKRKENRHDQSILSMILKVEVPDGAKGAVLLKSALFRA